MSFDDRHAQCIILCYSLPHNSGANIMRVSKWGNNLAVRLPKRLVESLGLKAGDEVELSPLPSGGIGVGKIDRRAEFLARMAQFNVSLPADYKFDRDEANER